jgi:hypothetical protein
LTILRPRNFRERGALRRLSITTHISRDFTLRWDSFEDLPEGRSFTGRVKTLHGDGFSSVPSQPILYTGDEGLVAL